MPVEVIMPKVDMDMASGTLSVWHIAEGALVEKGAALFDIETDKAAMEVESPASGYLHHICAVPGQVVAVGTAMAWIYAAGEAVGAAPNSDPHPAKAQTPGPAALVPASDPGLPSRSGSDAGGIRATPAARRLAREAGIALETIPGTGPHGRIQRADIEALQPLAAPAIATGWQAQPGELHITKRPGTGTPLLLLHGFAADGTGWAPLERLLPPDLPLIRIDLPSHGKSPRRNIANFAALARMMVEAFDRVGVDKVHLLGHSLGGAVALALADTRPRQIVSLTLISPAGLGPEIDGAVLNGIARASRVESLLPWLKRLSGNPDFITEDFAKAAMLPRKDPALREAQIAMADAVFPDGVQAFDLTAALQRTTAPTAILWGRSDHVAPWRQALAARGDMALHLLEKTGHIPHLECPQIVAGILQRQFRQGMLP